MDGHQKTKYQFLRSRSSSLYRSTSNTLTVFENAIKNNVIDQPIFSFYLGDNAPGELTFGGYDVTKFEGDLVSVKLDAATYWQIMLDGIQAGSAYSSGPWILQRLLVIHPKRMSLPLSSCLQLQLSVPKRERTWVAEYQTLPN